MRQAYHALRPAISSLVLLLHDEEEKTRANAAGALGNLVRNSYVQSCTYAIACVGGVSSMGLLGQGVAGAGHGDREGGRSAAAHGRA